MANHNPKMKLPLDEKSQKWQFNLDPKKTDDLWCIDAANKKMQEMGWSMQELFKQGVAALYDEKRPEREVQVAGVDMNAIQNKLDWIMEQIESGRWVMSEGETRKRGKKDRRIEISDIMQPTVDRYIDEGYVPDESDE